MSTLTQEPRQIVAGDSLSWLRSLADYPATEGWALHYVLLGRGKTPITLDSAPQDAAHQVDLPAATTAGWAPGEYHWTAYVKKGTERRTLGSGQLVILPDPTTATATSDPRSQNQKILDAINAVLAGELTNPLAEYKIAGREAKRHSRMELLKLQGIFKHRVAVENGAPLFGTIPIQFASDNGFNTPDGGGYA